MVTAWQGCIPKDDTKAASIGVGSLRCSITMDGDPPKPEQYPPDFHEFSAMRAVPRPVLFACQHNKRLRRAMRAECRARHAVCTVISDRRDNRRFSDRSRCDGPIIIYDWKWCKFCSYRCKCPECGLCVPESKYCLGRVPEHRFMGMCDKADDCRRILAATLIQRWWLRTSHDPAFAVARRIFFARMERDGAVYHSQ
mgnify:CR=1 FL=1